MSFEVTVSPQIYDVDVEVSPQVQPFEVDITVLDGIPDSRTITINGVTYDLSEDRVWSVGTVTSVSALSIGSNGTDINSSVANPTTSPVIALNIPTASAINRGVLSPSDWSTFNNKENTITGGTTSQYFRGDKTFQDFDTASRASVLTGFATGANTTILGTDTILGAFQKAQGQINARVSGTGVSGQVAFWSGTGSQTGDSGLTWDNTNKRLLIGSGQSFSTLQVSTNAATASILSWDTRAVGAFIRILGDSTNQNLINYGAATSLRFASSDLGFGSFTERMRISSGGNLLINTITDAGFRLDVNGTARVQGALTVAANSATGILSVNNASTNVSISMASLLASGAIGDTYFAVGRALTTNNSALFGHSTVGGGSYAFITMFNRPANDFAITSTGAIGIGTSLPNASARLQIDSTTAGFLPPRMTSAQRNAIASPATGLMVYNTTDNRPSFFNGTSWINL
jgi:hypothetical protein